MSLTIRPVRTKSDLAAFIALPRHIYAGMKGFVAPLDHERRQLLDPDLSGFHTHGESAYFIACRGDRPVGRISAQIDHLATAAPLSDTGFFGCLDVIDAADVCNALLETAEAWLRERGKRIAQGPFLLSINGESGLLLSGYDEPPMLLMPWHPPYLRERLQEKGYRLVKVLHSSTLDVKDGGVAERMKRLGLERRRQDFTIRPMRFGRSGLSADVEAGRQLFNESWADNWGFIPVSAEEMAKMIAGFRQLLKPEYGVMVERGGKLLGFALFLPNVFDLSGDLGGAPSPLGWLKLAYRGVTRRFASGRVVLFGVSKSLLGSLSGASVALILLDEFVRRSATSPYRWIECGWVLDDNAAMRSVVDWTGARPSRQFGVFERTLDGTSGDAASTISDRTS